MGDQDFWARAERLGHSAELLRADQTVRSVIDVANMDELRALLNDGSGAGGARRGRTGATACRGARGRGRGSSSTSAW